MMSVSIPWTKADFWGRRVSHSPTFLWSLLWPADARKLHDAMKVKSLIVLLWHLRFWQEETTTNQELVTTVEVTVCRQETNQAVNYNTTLEFVAVFMTGCAFASTMHFFANDTISVICYFILWKAEQLMLVNLEGPPLKPFDFLPALRL